MKPTKYELLEPNSAAQFGTQSYSFDTNTPATLFSSTSFIWSLAFVIIIVTASFRYAFAGMLRIQASEEGIRKSKEEFTRVTYGLLGVLGLWLILYTVNKDMLTGNVGLDGLKLNKSTIGGGLTQAGTGSGTGSGSGTSRACEDEAVVKASITSPNGICGTTACKLSNTCLTNNPYISYIKSESQRLNVNYRMIVVTMCKESNANPEASNQNPNGTYDCGIMQINQSTSCGDAATLRANVNANITKGIELMKQKINATNQSYPGFPNVSGVPVAGVFASYNCCANGTVPNSPSASCTSANGWPSVPKWACPVDPGTGTYNMCGVKAYACELTNCLKNVP